MARTTANESMNRAITWGILPTIPDEIGFAGSFAGIANDALIVAGGANFPDGGAPWTGSKKVWHDDIFALDQPDGQWKVVGKLPQPMGYGISISCKQGILLIGGNNQDSFNANVQLLRYDGSSVAFQALPDLPKPLANATGVILEDVVYVLGGTVDPAAKESESNFWALDLAHQGAAWKELPSWPGPSRMLATAGVQGEYVYLFSGTQLQNGERTYLKDAYRYCLRVGWEKLADLPQAVVAAPCPAFTDPQGHLLIFGGDDGSLAGLNPEKERHPGFSKLVWSYDGTTNSWAIRDILPLYAAVTTPLVYWRNRIIIPGGEIKPSVRTTEVITATLNE